MTYVFLTILAESVNERRNCVLRRRKEHGDERMNVSLLDSFKIANAVFFTFSAKAKSESLAGLRLYWKN
jgi:hypothetical protein